MRKNQRYVTQKELGIKVKMKDMQEAVIDGKLFDISLDGMKLETCDKRIEALKAISISVDDFRVELPCKKIWQEDGYYRIEFKSMDQQEFTNFEYFNENYIKTAPDNLLKLLM